MSHAAIAKDVGLSGPAVHERVRKLERQGIIKGYTAVIDPESIGKFHVAFTLVSTVDGVEFAHDEEVVRRICAEPDVLEFHRVAGQDCYLVKIRTETNKDLEHVLRRIRTIPGVARSRTTIALSTELEQPTVTIPDESPRLEIVSD
jgi:Lrp/AsnC family leucine-responsive transcriptional regulator